MQIRLFDRHNVCLALLLLFFYFFLFSLAASSNLELSLHDFLKYFNYSIWIGS